jgi:hypothetical protein
MMGENPFDEGMRKAQERATKFNAQEEIDDLSDKLAANHKRLMTNKKDVITIDDVGLTIESICSACARKDELLRRAREYVTTEGHSRQDEINLHVQRRALLAEIDKEVKG